MTAATQLPIARLPRKHRWIVGLGLTLFTCAATACGSSTSASTESSDKAGTGADSAVVSQAKELIAAATTRVVSSTTLTDELKTVTEFNGPAASAPITRNKKVIAIAPCVDPCDFAGDVIKRLGSQWGWSYQLLQSPDGGPQSMQGLTETAISQHPDAIVILGAPDLELTAQIAKAHRQGIKLVGFDSTQHLTPGFDAYTSIRADVQYRLEAYAAIADSNGHANMLLVAPSGFPDIDTYLKGVKAIFGRCAGCHLDVQTVAPGDYFSPTAIRAFVTARLNAAPAIGYVAYLDDTASPQAIRAAIRASGRDVKQISGAGSSPGLAAVKDSSQLLDVGVAVEWCSYAAVDQLRRLFAGQRPLSADGWGGGAHIWTSANLPAELTSQAAADAFNATIDYRSAYQRIWNAAG